MKGADIYARFPLYVIERLAENLLGYGMFLGLILTDIAPMIAFGIAFVVMVFANYMTNCKWTFRSRDSHVRDLRAYGVGLLAALLSMYVLSRILHTALAQMAVVSLVTAMIFICLKHTQFGKKDKSYAH